MRTIVNMVERLGDRFEFRVVTNDHDGPGDTTQYSSVKIDEWDRCGDTRVLYLSKANFRAGSIGRIIREAAPHAIYTNSAFSRATRLLLRLRITNTMGKVPIVI